MEAATWKSAAHPATAPSKLPSSAMSARNTVSRSFPSTADSIRHALAAATVRTRASAQPWPWPLLTSRSGGPNRERLRTWVPRRGVDAAAPPQQRADEPRADVAGSPRHAHRRGVLLRRAADADAAHLDRSRTL